MRRSYSPRPFHGTPPLPRAKSPCPGTCLSAFFPLLDPRGTNESCLQPILDSFCASGRLLARLSPGKPMSGGASHCGLLVVDSVGRLTGLFLSKRPSGSSASSE